jgi:putative oxidoreductase
MTFSDRPIVPEYSSLANARYSRVTAILNYLQPAVLLLIRVAWGFEAAQAGWGHLHSIDATAANFANWGVPMPRANVYIAGSTELVGGILLILGLGTRFIAAPLVFNFIVAIVAAGRGNIVKALHDHGPVSAFTTIVDDTAFPFEITALIALAFGAGTISLDYVLARTIFHYKGARA